jgi:hypothetical protein
VTGMTREIGEVELVPPCGMYCGSCKFYLAEKCEGCKKIRKEICPIWKCAEERGVRFCGECQDFPCDENYSVPALAEQWLEEIEEAFGKSD